MREETVRYVHWPLGAAWKLQLEFWRLLMIHMQFPKSKQGLHLKWWLIALPYIFYLMSPLCAQSPGFQEGHPNKPHSQPSRHWVLCSGFTSPQGAWTPILVLPTPGFVHPEIIASSDSRTLSSSDPSSPPQAWCLTQGVHLRERVEKWMTGSPAQQSLPGSKSSVYPSPAGTSTLSLDKECLASSSWRSLQFCALNTRQSIPVSLQLHLRTGGTDSAVGKTWIPQAPCFFHL